MTDSDWNPFADDVKEEIVTEVIESDNGLELGFTIKQASTTGAPWLTGKGPRKEVEAFLSDKPAVKAVLDGLHEAVDYFTGLLPVGEGTPAATTAPSPTSAPGGEVRKCQHGEMTFRSGSKNGRVWKAFFCPTPEGTADQCKPQFLKG